MRTQAIDHELAEVEGVDRWEEHIHGTTAHCCLDGRHLRAVLGARATYLTTVTGTPGYALPGLRTTYPAPKLVPLPAAKRRTG